MQPRRKGPYRRRTPARRSTPPGGHVPVLLGQVLEVLQPQAGQVAVDCTLGFGGHAVELLKRIGPEGLLLAFDLDAENLERARPRLEEVGHPFRLIHGNFAGLDRVLGEQGILGIDLLVADLGMSSLQLDDAERGFSYVRDGELDMRLDRSRGRTAAHLVATLSEEEWIAHLETLGDEPQAALIARAIVRARSEAPIERTGRLARIVQEALGQTDWRLRPGAGKKVQHPAMRTFQTLRILVNRELANLTHLLRVLPQCLLPGGRAALISFHSGEDRLVKSAFRDGVRRGEYSEVSGDPVRPDFEERQTNPRSRSAKLRWARRAET